MRMWIYLPVPDPNGMRNRMFLYDMTPVHTKIVTDEDLFDRDPDVLQGVIANWDYLWFPIKNPIVDEKLKTLSGDDLKDFVFRVARRDGEVEVVALDGVFN